MTWKLLPYPFFTVIDNNLLISLLLCGNKFDDIKNKKNINVNYKFH